MSLLEITGLTHSFGDNYLFKDAELALNKGEHIGVVGQNGVGKSTLIKICTEQVIPDAGRVVWQPKVTVGCLDQYAQIEKNMVIRDLLKSAFAKLYEAEDNMNRLYEEAADGNVNSLNLAGLENAYIVVSHDYVFLERISTRICDIDNQKITKYYGTYSAFTKKKALLREDYIRRYVTQQKEIKKTEEFIRRNIAGQNSKMARGRQKQLNRLDKIDALEQKEIKPYFRFSALPATTTEHLLVKRLAVGYHYPVLPDISFSVKGQEKVVISGFNGIGKSTLLKTLTGQLIPLGGEFYFSNQAVIGYFEQDLKWGNDMQTPIQIISDAYPSLAIKEVRKHLARCGISNKHAMQTISTLSGGEQAKVKMCLLMLTPCNFLILDEPTNHLDVQAKEALKAALSEFEGTILLVSHEEAFYCNWTNKVIRIDKR